MAEAQGRIAELQGKRQSGALSVEEEIELDHYEKVLASTQVRHLERELEVIRGLPEPRELDQAKADALADAKAALARPVPGMAALHMQEN